MTNEKLYIITLTAAVCTLLLLTHLVKQYKVVCYQHGTWLECGVAEREFILK